MTVQRPDAFDAVLDFEPVITLPTATTTSFDPSPSTESRGLALLLTGLAGVIVGGGFLLTMRQLTFKPQTVMAMVFLVGSVIFAQSGMQLLIDQEITNPIVPDANSLMIGGDLYAEHCAMCHGDQGRGDGPFAVTLNPRPADLAIHTAPGKHPDSQLYAWITDGLPTTAAMPAFGTLLSDDERWHLVNYLRTFALDDES
jgi:mono/diheme cytochrome c family protein